MMFDVPWQLMLIAGFPGISLLSRMSQLLMVLLSLPNSPVVVPIHIAPPNVVSIEVFPLSIIEY